MMVSENRGVYCITNENEISQDIQLNAKRNKKEMLITLKPIKNRMETSSESSSFIFRR